MNSLLDKLPTILILAVLVGIFVSLRKHAPSTRMRLWIWGWALIFVHFFVQVFEVAGRTGTLEAIFDSLDLAALELSGLVFLISLTMLAEDRLRRSFLFLLLAAPVAFHAIAASFNWQLRWTLSACVAVVFFGGAVYPYLVSRGASPCRLFTTSLAFLAGAWSLRAQLHGDPNPAITSVLALSFGLSGVLFWQRMPRWSPGVLTVVAGFLAWGAVFPVGMLTDAFFPHLKINPEIWNVPKFFVAFGMILTVLEDKSRLIEESNARERAENAMLRSFSKVTSRLLMAGEPADLCGEICQAVTQTSRFTSAAVLLTARDASLSVAGSSGLSQEQDRLLVQRIRSINAARAQDIANKGQRWGHHSARISCNFLLDAPAHHTPTGSNEALGPETMIPLMPSRGTAIGWLLLALPPHAGPVGEHELNKVEILATDLAVTIENTRLHGQLRRTEKLASLGQLVAGVAHELNNPLTGIIGYSDLLADELRHHSAAKRVQKLGLEAWRMKRIVDGLLRFSHQNQAPEKTSNLELALQDTVLLREYSLRARGVDVRMEIDPELPEVTIGADELKQIVLNLLNNALDAVEETPQKSILIQAARKGQRVELRIEDSGTGFADLNRACDPFYTTKPPGKGTGLGLSICYGLIHGCGGEIHLTNKQPRGAAVTIGFPVFAAAPAAATA